MENTKLSYKIFAENCGLGNLAVAGNQLVAVEQVENVEILASTLLPHIHLKLHHLEFSRILHPISCRLGSHHYHISKTSELHALPKT